MNIIVFENGAISELRPDSTWERENKDLYVPDGIKGYTFRPVLFAKCLKSGKAVAEKFAERYFESVGWGVLLTPEIEGLASAQLACYDSTSYLSFPLYNKVVINSGYGNEFAVESPCGSEVFKVETSEAMLAELGKAVSAVSKVMSFKTGDFICVPLDEARKLPSNELRATFAVNTVLDFKLIY